MTGRRMIKITIVIATFNAEKYLSVVLESIVKQNYPHTEVVVIDGQSKDNTVGIIRKFESTIAYWVSEPDTGIYDAWNKGVRNSTGEWVMFLGSDDYLLPGALQSYADFIERQDGDPDLVSSKLSYADKDLMPYRIAGWPWEWPRFQHVNTIAHPGALHSRKLFLDYGAFDTRYRICGDYEFLLRPGPTLKAAFMDSVTVLFREGGASDGYAAIRESFNASVSTGRAPLIPMYAYAAVAYFKYFVRSAFQRLGIRIAGRKQTA